MRRHLLALPIVALLAACNTVPEPVVETVNIEVAEIRTCTPTSELNRIVVPAVTQVFWGITEIDNPPYEPIQSREKITREVEPERVYYENTDGFVVSDICDLPPEDAARLAPPAQGNDAMMTDTPDAPVNP